MNELREKVDKLYELSKLRLKELKLKELKLRELIEEVRADKDKIFNLQIAEVIQGILSSNIKTKDIDGFYELIKNACELLYTKSKVLLNISGLSIEEELSIAEPIRESSFISQGESLLSEYIKEYKFYSNLAEELKNKLEVAEKTYTRSSKELFYDQDFDAFSLAEVLFRIINKNIKEPQEPFYECQISKITIHHKMREIEERLNLEKKFNLVEMLSSTSKIEIIILILALLELAKSGKIRIYQENPFADIWIITK